MRSRQGRLLLIVGTVFGAAGVILIVAAVIVALDARRFQAGATRTDGTVIGVDAHRECHTGGSRHGHSGCHTVYRPTVRFSTADGRTITFRPSTSSSRRPEIGSRLPVLYHADDPGHARLAGAAQWAAPVGLAALGLPFAAVGGILIGLQVRRRRRHAWLHAHGRRVQAEIVGADQNRSVRINGVRPWRIHAVWQDRSTGLRHRVTSENILADPRAALAGRSVIDVLVDPADPARRPLVDLASVGLDRA